VPVLAGVFFSFRSESRRAGQERSTFGPRPFPFFPPPTPSLEIGQAVPKGERSLYPSGKAHLSEFFFGPPFAEKVRVGSVCFSPKSHLHEGASFRHLSLFFQPAEPRGSLVPFERFPRVLPSPNTSCAHKEFFMGIFLETLCRSPLIALFLSKK